MKNTPLAYIELSQEHLVHNIKTLKSLAKKGTKFAFAIKGNAYGHGQNEIAKIAERYVDFFQVNSVLELALLRKVSNKKTLLLGYVPKSELVKVLKLNCILSVFSLDELSALNAVALKSNTVQEIHLPIDAHLGREGFRIEALSGVLEEIKNSKGVKLTGVYAHFANIEDTNNFTHATKQIKAYEKALEIARDYGFTKLTTHISATSGLLVYEKENGINPIVRMGIGAYGLWPSPHIKFMYKNKLDLRPVLSFKTKVAQVKVLPPGATVGYGLTYMTEEETKVALLPVGYADGLDRELSNRGHVLIQGARCEILGRVSMNMTVVNVSHLESIEPEDEVVIMGTQGTETITAEEFADGAHTINYEAVTRLSSLLPRVVV